MKKKGAFSNEDRIDRLLVKSERLGKIVVNKKHCIETDEFRKKFKNRESEALKFVHLVRTMGNLFAPIITDPKFEKLPRCVKSLVSRNNLSRYIKEGLLSYEEGRDSDAQFTLHTIALRLPLVKRCHEILKYPFSRIKEIVRFENLLIKWLKQHQLGKVDGRLILLHPDLSGSPMVFLLKYCEWLYDYAELALRKPELPRVDTVPVVEILRKPKPEDIDIIDLIGYGPIDLSEKGLTEIYLLAETLWLSWENWSLSDLFAINKAVEDGYSPQWYFELACQGRKDRQKGLYILEQFGGLTFFRTPEFEVSMKKEKILVSILDIDNITTTKKWKYIGSIYSRFRKHLKAKRAGWGTLSGERERQDKIADTVQEAFWWFREHHPKRGAYDALDFANQRLQEMFDFELSYDTLKKKVYPKKSAKNKSTNSKYDKNK